MLDLIPESDVKIQWTPSHLDDPKKKDKHTKAGITTEAHIAGNVIADGLAAGGARMHFIDPMTLIMADDKAELTAIVQTHLITSWSG